MSFRAWIKPVAEAVLARGGPAALARRLHRDRVAILAYHNVRPVGVEATGERTLHIGAEAFARHLDALQDAHRVVSLHSVLDGPPHGTLPSSPLVVITFDDGYRGALTVGVEELRRRGLCATVFVAPALLGDRTFWWDALADPATGALAPEVRRHALWELGGEHERVLAWARGAGLPVRDMAAPALRSATPGELAEAAEGGVLEPASHTWAHRNLGALGPPEWKQELGRSREWLLERFPGRDPEPVAYPYGIHPASAAEGGHPHVGLGLEGRLARSGTSATLPRINVPADLSPEGLVLRVSGLWRS